MVTNDADTALWPLPELSWAGFVFFRFLEALLSIEHRRYLELYFDFPPFLSLSSRILFSLSFPDQRSQLVGRSVVGRSLRTRLSGLTFGSLSMFCSRPLQVRTSGLRPGIKKRANSDIL